MNFDAERQLGSAERSVAASERDGQPLRVVTLSRSYTASLGHLWNAVTRCERLTQWFLPVSGDLRPGGRYQLEGNAGGVITACERPWHLALTWEFGDDTSWLDICLSEDDTERARLEVAHAQHLSEHWSRYGPGASGIGWELTLLGLAFHLDRPSAPKPDAAAFAASRDGTAFIRGSGAGWERVAVACGKDPGEAKAAAGRAIAFYTGEPADTP